MADTLAVIAGKLSARVIRSVGAGLGSNVPGRVSRLISAKVLANLAAQARRGVVAVSGTNGKSTTCGFVASILSACGYKLAHNRQGANLVPGITASLVDAADWSGQLKADYCLFEADEAALPLVAAEVPIATVVVTNLFRDQLDRFGELDTTRALIAKGIAVNHSQAILNADDPNVAQLAADARAIFYGIASLAAPSEPPSASNAPSGNVTELAYCPSCGNEYKYDQVFYGQLGHYSCQCGSRRQEPEIWAEDVQVTASGSSFKIVTKSGSVAISLPLPGLFNVYNALAAAALAVSMGAELEHVRGGLEGYQTLFGRSERLTIEGKQVLIQLIKNPAGASQAVRAAVSDPAAQLLIAINDNYADGRDVSWLWDADFDQLGACKKPIFVSGIRAADMAVRLKYAGVAAQNIRLLPPLADALSSALAATATNETLWILPTYTCLLKLQKIARAPVTHSRELRLQNEIAR